MSSGDTPSRRMFSTIPFAETPVSNRSVRSRPPLSIRTSAENPGSAISESGTPRSGAVTAAARGSAPLSAFGQFTRRTASLIDQQRIGEVVNQHRHPDPVHRLERDHAHSISIKPTITTGPSSHEQPLLVPQPVRSADLDSGACWGRLLRLGRR